MAHLLERNHGERFTKLMDKFMPDWRSRRDELNKAPLADERWHREIPPDCRPLGRPKPGPHSSVEARCRNQNPYLFLAFSSLGSMLGYPSRTRRSLTSSRLFLTISASASVTRPRWGVPACSILA